MAQFEIIHAQRVGSRGNTKLYIGKDLKRGYNAAIFVKQEDTIFRDGNSMNKAIEEGTLCWMMDESLLPVLEFKFEVQMVYFFKLGSEDIWVSYLSDWLDPDKRYIPQNVNTFERRHSNESLVRLSVENMKESPGRRNLFVR